MSGALVKGFLNSGITEPEKLYVSSRSESTKETARELGVTRIMGDSLKEKLSNIKKMVEFSDVILVGVKPNAMDEVLEKLSGVIEPRHLIVSIAAGVTIERMENLLPEYAKVVRVMPNTPTLVKSGVSSYSLGKNATEEDAEVVEKLLSEVGVAIRVKEDMIHAVIGVSGSGPAYIYMMIEAMADGGVAAGLPRNISLMLAAKTVEGAAKMVLESNPDELTHPGVLKDRVASPGGTTIEAIKELEINGIRSAFIKAVLTANNKSIEMSKKH